VWPLVYLAGLYDEHNVFVCKCKNVALHILPLKAKEIDVKEEEFNSEAIARLIPRIEWQALCQAADSVSTLVLEYRIRKTSLGAKDLFYPNLLKQEIEV
jgi:hypothetical protein